MGPFALSVVPDCAIVIGALWAYWKFFKGRIPQASGSHCGGELAHRRLVYAFAPGYTEEHRLCRYPVAR